MNRRVFFLCLLAAIPSVLRAQEYKLVNCRTLEAAGNFVGSDEVLNGDMVCQKVKAGAADRARAEAAKPLPGTVISGSEPAKVVDAAKAKVKKPEPADDGAAEEAPAAAVPVVLPSARAATAEPQAAVPEERSPMTAPDTSSPPVMNPQMALPVKQSPSELTAGTESRGEGPAAAIVVQPGTTAVSAVAAPVPPAVQIHRDAPVAAGTPSTPPEKDYGFSDANAVETPAVAPAAAVGSATAKARSGDQNGAHSVQLGAFDKQAPEASDGASQPDNTNSRPGDTNGFQEGQRPECTKNVTLGSLRDEKLVLGIPGWAQKWIEKNQKQLANICFSATPMHGARNYLIVFYALPGSAQGQNNAMPMPDATAGGGVGGFTTKYGSTWHYLIDSKVGTTALTQKGAHEPHSDEAVWYATAYTEDGAPVAERWPEQGKHAGENKPKVQEQAEHAAEELFADVVEDLRKM